MAGHSTHEMKQHLQIYMRVFVALLVFTGVTVGLAYFHLSPFWAVFLAMLVACTKGGLVAGYFMHLIGEKKIILWCLVLTLFMFAVLMIVPVLTIMDQVEVMGVS